MEACGECSGKIEVKKGPTGNVKQSSKETATKICPKMKQKQVLPPCPVGQPIPPCPVGVVGAPIPIVVQPLPASPRGAAQSLKLYPLKVNPTQSISTIHAGESDKSVPPQQRR